MERINRVSNLNEYLKLFAFHIHTQTRREVIFAASEVNFIIVCFHIENETETEKSF